MELLTKLRYEGTDRVEAWCEGCKKWIQEVCLLDGCQPGNRTYVYCEACGEALIRSKPIPKESAMDTIKKYVDRELIKKHDETCMNPHIDKVCDADCQIYTECVGNGE